MKISIIIPAYNEEKVIGACLESLEQQTYNNLEIIVVDDGSVDRTLQILRNIESNNPTVRVLKQDHKGAGAARNLGAKEAKGETLVFVDADMVFDSKFIEMLTKPIREKKLLGTFSKEEYVLNKDNVWSKCWNINKGLPVNRMHQEDYPNLQPVFRAVLKKEFDQVNGFDTIGYIDDHSLSKKLGQQAISAPGAIFYHRNPENLQEIFSQARWIGKSEFKNRKIKNESIMKTISIIRYSPVFSLINGFVNAIRFGLPEFILFKFVYDIAIEISLFRSFFGEQINK